MANSVAKATDETFIRELLENWVRATFCFRKMEGKWLVTHQHISMPVGKRNTVPMARAKTPQNHASKLAHFCRDA